MTGFTTTLPTKRMAACALLLNEQHEWLIVKPTYRSDWLVPGGTIDTNESPLKACNREVQEEIGLDLSIEQLLCIGYQPPHGTKSESMQFIFWGGILTDDQINSIRLPSDELSQFRFVLPDTAGQLLPPKLTQRLKFAEKARLENRIIYLEDRQELAS